MKSELTKELDTMIVLATVNHSGQVDKGGNPYILHPLAVMYMVESSDLQVKAMAVGHDTIEDTKLTYAEMREKGISERVIDGIRALTKQPGQTYDEYKTQVFMNRDAMIVKMADLRHNSDIRRLKGVTAKDIERMAKYHAFYLELQERLKSYPVDTTR